MITGIINSIDTNVDQLVLMKIIRYTSENWASNCKSYDANAAGKLVSIVTKTFNEYQNVSKINDIAATKFFADFFIITLTAIQSDAKKEFPQLQTAAYNLILANHANKGTRRIRN